MKKIFYDYSSLSKKESIAAYCLVAIILIFIIFPFFLSNKNNAIQPNAQLVKIADSVSLLLKDTNSKNYTSHYTSTTTNKDDAKYVLHPFNFNPNELDENGFAQLGLPIKLVKTIMNYKNHGGKFYKPDDFRKIWGLKKEDADILVPYIIINQKSNYTSNSINSNYQKNNTITTPSKVDINIAAMQDFRQLPTVGNLAYKIVNYRDKLGGFISINQIKEVHGMNDTIFAAIQPYLLLQNTEIKKININTATDFDLANHPYISREYAKAVTIYRTQHGNYKSIQDLKKIIFIKKDWVDKIAPYITTE